MSLLALLVVGADTAYARPPAVAMAACEAFGSGGVAATVLAHWSVLLIVSAASISRVQTLTLLLLARIVGARVLPERVRPEWDRERQ